MGWIERESGGRMGMNRKGEWREDGDESKGGVEGG